MTRARVQPVACRSALNRSPSNLPFRWSLNPYRGCQHACRYCFARSYHGYLDLDPGRDFEELILAKTNLPEALRRHLARPGWRGEAITIGTASDPYQPVEAQLRITRGCLEVLADGRNPCFLTTKGTLAARDVDLMQQLTRDAGFGLNLSLISLDRDLLRRLEPGAPPPASRLSLVERLAAAGVSVHVFLVPVVPGITDRPEHLRQVVKAVAERGAASVSPGVLRLAPSVKESFLSFLQAEFPHLVPSYERGYRAGRDAPRAYRARIEHLVGALCSEAAFPPAAASPRDVLPRGQLPLPL